MFQSIASLCSIIFDPRGVMGPSKSASWPLVFRIEFESVRIDTAQIGRGRHVNLLHADTTAHVQSSKLIYDPADITCSTEVEVALTSLTSLFNLAYSLTAEQSAWASQAFTSTASTDRPQQRIRQVSACIEDAYLHNVQQFIERHEVNGNSLPIIFIWAETWRDLQCERKWPRKSDTIRTYTGPGSVTHLTI